MGMFKPRKTKPLSSDKYYQHITRGGYSTYGAVYLPFGARPQCTGYAYCRVLEIAGLEAEGNSYFDTLTGASKDWIRNSAGQLTSGQTPALGSIICWGAGGVSSQPYGHVAVVEDISSASAGVIWISEYWAYNPEAGRPFGEWHYMEVKKRSDGQWHSNWTDSKGFQYKFQGFIYHPCISGEGASGISGYAGGAIGGYRPHGKLSEFVETVTAKLGETSTWISALSSITPNNNLSGAFVRACAHAVGGLLGVVIPDTCCTADIAPKGLRQELGTWITGKNYGGSGLPQIGDIAILLNSPSTKYSSKYAGDYAGVVTSISEGHFTIIGYRKTKVVEEQHNIDNNVVRGFYRPFWYKVGSTQLEFTGYIPSHVTTFDRHDALFREIGYIDTTNYQPSIISEGLELTMVNILAPITAITEIAGTSTPYSYSADAGDLSGVPREVFDSLRTISGGELSPAAIAGILGNMEAESNFKLASDGWDVNAKSAGLCQWHGGRRDAMIKFCTDLGLDWKTSTLAQCKYLWKELNEGYKDVLAVLKGVKNDTSGVDTASRYWMLHFERPANQTEANQQKRVERSLKFWNMMNPYLARKQLTRSGLTQVM